MDAARALKLSPGALYGVRFLTVQQIRDRVSSRYPEAASLPERPALDDLLCETGFDFHWIRPPKEVAVMSAGCEKRTQSPVEVSRSYGCQQR